MNDITSLFAIAIFMAGIFAMAGLRLWYITHQDVNMSKKVNGLSIDVGKIKKQLKDGSAGVVKELPGSINMPVDMLNMTLEDAAEAIGFSKEELNNPIVRPIAEKIFQGIKAKAQQGETDEPNIEML